MLNLSRSVSIALVVLALLAGRGAATAQATASAADESARLYAWFDEAFRDELRHSPQAQTMLGMTVDATRR
jgi:hypothetical protein